MSVNTAQQYDKALESCRTVFVNKAHDYGLSWRLMRPSTLLDQIFIKAKRLRTIDEKKEQRIGDDAASEYVGIINYAIMTLIQRELEDSPALNDEPKEDVNLEDVIAKYDHHTRHIKELMQAKNHDYGEAWRDMLISSFTDMILTRIERIRSLAGLNGKTRMSEGIDSNLYDMVNYAIFALIKLDEEKNQPNIHEDHY